MTISVDLMGGDHAPEAVISGIGLALEKTDASVSFLLYGSKDALEAASSKLKGADASRIRCIETTEVIDCEEAPTAAIRKKKDSSLVKAVESVACGESDCVVSAGNTGALLAAATLIIKRIKGVKRPALVTALPNVNSGYTVLLDSGANTDCKPEYLNQFGIMGAEYAKANLDIADPRVALLNNGAEKAKGNELTKQAYQLLEASEYIRFCGNCEARDVLSGDYDVIVADGFDGNVLLKGIEGTAMALFRMLKDELYASARTKIGALLAKPAFRTLKHKMDYSEVGGAVLLGVNGGVIKAHGSSNAKAFMNAILQAEKLIKSGMIDTITRYFAVQQTENE